jgi:hypothetical protein
MSEVPRGVGQEQSSKSVARWLDRSRHYVLPTAGAIAFALGVSLAIDTRVPWGVYTPRVLVILGFGALATGLVRLAIRSDLPSGATGRSEQAPKGTDIVGPSCNARALEAAPPPHHPLRRVTRPSWWSVSSKDSFSIPADPGHFLWGSWVPPTRKLPGELIGPVPETAYVPHRPGTPSLYEEGELFLPGFAPSPSAPERASSLAVDWSDLPPFPARSGAQMRQPEAMTPPPKKDPGGPVFSGGSSPAAPFGNVPERVSSIAGDSPGRPPAPDLTYREDREPNAEATPSKKSATASVPPSEGSSSHRTSTWDRVRHEVLNPTPPHLRHHPKHARSPGPEGLLRSQELPPGVRCANCREPVRDPKSWRRCTDCLRHLCEDCIVEALLLYERGWCSRCAQRRYQEAPLAELAPRGHPTVEESSAPVTSLAIPMTVRGGLEAGGNVPR